MDEILGKKDGTADGMVDGFTLGTNDGLDVGYAFGSSDESEVGIIDRAPLGSSVGKTVGPGFRLGKVKGSTDGTDDGIIVGFKDGCTDGIILVVDGNSVGSFVGPILGIKLDGK